MDFDKRLPKSTGLGTTKNQSWKQGSINIPIWRLIRHIPRCMGILRNFLHVAFVLEQCVIPVGRIPRHGRRVKWPSLPFTQEELNWEPAGLPALPASAATGSWLLGAVPTVLLLSLCLCAWRLLYTSLIPTLGCWLGSPILPKSRQVALSGHNRLPQNMPYNDKSHLTHPILF